MNEQQEEIFTFIQIERRMLWMPSAGVDQLSDKNREQKELLRGYPIKQIPDTEVQQRIYLTAESRSPCCNYNFLKRAKSHRIPSEL